MVIVDEREWYRSPEWLFGERTRVLLALITSQIGYAGYMVWAKVVMSNGMDRFVFAAYRDCVALSLLAPAAFFAERHLRTAVKWRVCVYIIALGIIGIFVQQTVLLAGITYTSPSFTAAMMNTIPVFTFLISIICRNEIILLNKVDGIAKVIGIFLCVTGAVILSLYKGPKLLGGEPVLPPAETEHGGGRDDWLTLILLRCGADHWQIGSAYLILGCLCVAIYINLQIPALKIFPAPVSLTAGSMAVGTIALVITGILSVSDASQWIVDSPENILSIVYAGAIVTGLNYALQAWVNHRCGPTLLASFSPLQTVISTSLGLLVTNDPLYLGSVIGAVVILAGLYFVVWARARHGRSLNTADLAVPFNSVIDDAKMPFLVSS